jgi:hypothetical protein
MQYLFLSLLYLITTRFDLTLRSSDVYTLTYIVALSSYYAACQSVFIFNFKTCKIFFKSLKVHKDLKLQILKLKIKMITCDIRLTGEEVSSFFFKFWIVRLLALRPLLVYCASLG